MSNPVKVLRYVEIVYTPGVKTVLWRVSLTAYPAAAPGWVWPDPLPVYVGEGDTEVHADAAAIATMKAALG